MNKLSLVDYAKKNDIKEINNLLDSGVDINLFDYDRSSLHAACVSNAIEAARLLIKRGINVNLQDRHTGATALHYCAAYNYFEIAKEIIENGGKLNIADNYGNEPLWTAVFNVKGKGNELLLVKLFLDNGGDKNHKNNAGRSPLDFANQVKFLPTIELLSNNSK